MAILYDDLTYWQKAAIYGGFIPVCQAIALTAAFALGYNKGHEDGYWEGHNYPRLFKETDDVTNY